MLIWRNDYAWLFAFADDGERQHKRPAYGVGLKLDGSSFNRPALRHFSVGVYGPTQKVGRGCWTWEALTWRTDGHGVGAKRLSVKAFLRIKIGLGGVPPERPAKLEPNPEVELRRRKRKITRDIAEMKELERVRKRTEKRQFAQAQKGPTVRRGLNGKALPNSRVTERGRP